MPACLRTLDLAPDPLEIARRLSDRPGLFVLGPGFGKGAWLLGCDPIESIVGWDPEPTLLAAPSAEVWAELPRWVGLLPYQKPHAGSSAQAGDEPTTSDPSPTRANRSGSATRPCSEWPSAWSAWRRTKRACAIWRSSAPAALRLRVLR